MQPQGTTPENRPVLSPAKAMTDCPTCGKSFIYYRSWPRIYCSLQCSGKKNGANLGARFQPYGPAQPINCEQCGSAITDVKGGNWKGRRFCDQRCFGDWQKTHTVFAGRRLPGSGRKPAKIPRVCPECNQTFMIKPNQDSRRVYCSKACYAKEQARRFSAERNPGWVGGRMPYYGPTWHAAKRATRARDKVCQRCGKSPKELRKALDVHHLTAFRDYGPERHEEANRLDNLIALCTPCHLTTEWEGNRRINHQKALQPPLL